jgi:preprotein translocase subunit SecB
MWKQEYSKFKLKKIALLSSIIFRKDHNYEPSKALSLKVEIGHKVIGNNISVHLTVGVIDGNDNDKPHKERELTLEATMAGDFEIIDSEKASKIDVLEFSEINAAAILFPYIRQHIRTLTLESGFTQPIILPIMNFVQMHEEKKKERENQETK